MLVMSNLATLGYSIHFYLSGTADEFGDDHWMLLEVWQQGGYSINESKVKQLSPNKAVGFCVCSAVSKILVKKYLVILALCFNTLGLKLSKYSELKVNSQF